VSLVVGAAGGVDWRADVFQRRGHHPDHGGPAGQRGGALGTVLAFMMSVVALSLPEAIILRKVLKMRLLVTFFAIVATGIMLVGYLFNVLM
jgi:hypothetical protein